VILAPCHLKYGRNVALIRLIWFMEQGKMWLSNFHLTLFCQLFQAFCPVLSYADLLTKWDCKSIEFNGEKDHVHLLFQYFPDIALNKLVTNFKSVSSRRIRQEYGEKLDAIYKKVLWNGSYFVASCGGVTVTTLRKYIEEQDKPA
jgi:putative transposase